MVIHRKNLNSPLINLTIKYDAFLSYFHVFKKRNLINFIFKIEYLPQFFSVNQNKSRKLDFLHQLTEIYFIESTNPSRSKTRHK